MLQPGGPGLNRDDAIRVLAELERLQLRLRRLQEQCEELVRKRSGRLAEYLARRRKELPGLVLRLTAALDGGLAAVDPDCDGEDAGAVADVLVDVSRVRPTRRLLVGVVASVRLPRLVAPRQRFSEEQKVRRLRLRRQLHDAVDDCLFGFLLGGHALTLPAGCPLDTSVELQECDSGQVRGWIPQIPAPRRGSASDRVRRSEERVTGVEPA